MTSAREWFEGKTFEELERIEHGGRLLYPDTVKRRSPTSPKDLVEVPVYIRVPSVREVAEARVEALAIVSDITGQNVQTESKAIEILGVQSWQEIDLYAVASHAILTREGKAESQFREAMPRRWQLPSFLLETVPRSTIYDVWSRIRQIEIFEDYRAPAISPDEVDVVIKAIVEKGNLSPFVGMSEGMRNAFTLSAVVQLASFRTRKPSSNSPETSTPGS